MQSSFWKGAKAENQGGYGMHTLIDKDPEAENVVDIVAVHGLNGHYEKTWTATLRNGSQVNWLRDLLPQQVRNTRIMSFSYDSTVQFSKSTSDIFTFADQLLEHLLAARQRAGEESRPIVFICHSLGGIVFKQAVNKAFETDRYRSFILKYIVGVAFFGVPHRGSSLAQWGNILSSMLKAASMGISTNSQLTKDLDHKSRALTNISNSFVERGKNLRILSFFETQKLDFMNCLVVERESATLGWPEEICHGIDGNHRSMCWFTHKDEPRYQPIWQNINEMVARAQFSTLRDWEEIFLSPSRIMSDLYTTDYKAHKERNPTAVIGTCTWIVNHSKYQQWLLSTGAYLLWISADAGCGKSVLASFLVDHLKRTLPDHNICYFFFKADSSEQRDAVSGLSAILHQLYSSQSSLIKVAQAQLRVPGQNLKNLSTLWEILTKSTEKRTDRSTGKVTPSPDARATICIIDGLDECEEATLKQLMKCITKYYTAIVADGNDNEKVEKHLRLLITSRPDNSIKNSFDRKPVLLEDNAMALKRPQFAMMRLRGEDEIDAISNDIELVIKDAMEDLIDRGLPQELLESIEKQLIARADRTFLWVTLIIQLLRERAEEGASRRELDEILKSRSVDAIYSALLDSRPNHAKARKMLSIILAALQPLTVEELSIALAVKPDNQTFQQGTQPRRPSLRTFDHLEYELVYPFENHIKSLCGHFIRIIHGKVYLAHQTAREFLLDQASLVEITDVAQFNTGDDDVFWAMEGDGMEDRLVSGPYFHKDFEDDVTTLVEVHDSAWQHSFSLLDAHALLLEICVSYIYLLGKQSRIPGLGLGEPSEKTAAFLQYAAQSWTTHFHRVCEKIPIRALPYYHGLCHPRFPGFVNWLETYGIVITRPIVGGSDDEQQDYFVNLLGLEPDEDGFTRRTKNTTVPTDANFLANAMMKLSSNPGASLNFHFPATADEDGFVSLNLDHTRKLFDSSRRDV